MNRYAKAIVAAFLAGGGAYSAALNGGSSVTMALITAIVTGLVTGAVTYGVPNSIVQDVEAVAKAVETAVDGATVPGIDGPAPKPTSS